MTNREMFLLATSILFASTTLGIALQGALHKGPHHGRGGYERPFDGPSKEMKERKRAAFFAESDTNSDGFLTREEMIAKQQKRLDELFETVDTDKDGKLSKDELEKGRELMHAKMKARFEAERKAAGEEPKAE